MRNKQSTNSVILFVAAWFIFLSPANCLAAGRITQETKGNQSPNVNISPGGTANFNYGAQNQNKDVAPEIKHRLIFPLKLANDALQRLKNPEISFTNVGPVKAIAFSVDYEHYIFDKSLYAVIGSFSLRSPTHGHLIFVKELPPAESTKQQLNAVHGEKYVGIYVFTISYYRELDMKMFKHKEIFFIEDYDIFTEKEYVGKGYYKKAIEAMKSYKPSGRKMHGEAVKGIDRNAWVVKTPETGISMLDDDRGGLTYGGVIPEDPRTVIKEFYSNVSRPLLYIRPEQSERTGAYVGDFETVSADTLKANIKYEVENIGDAEAVNVSGIDGERHNKVLKAGEKFYINIKVTLKNESSHHLSMQDMLRDMEKQQYVIEHGATVFYFQESANKEYRTTSIYKIEGNNVQLIKIETK